MPLRYWLDNKLQRKRLSNELELQRRELESRESLEEHRLDLERKHAQRRELQDLKTRYQGRLVEASDLFHFRMLNLYEHVEERWLDVGADLGDPDRYYFHSSVRRFLVLLSLALRLERAAFFIEERYADENEVQFLWFCKGMRWVATDVPILFHGVRTYDKANARDHFFTDELGELCRLVADGDAPEMGLTEFTSLAREPEIRPAMMFFDGLRPDEDRHRWDRLVALHLIVMAFLNNFGYRPQQTEKPQLIEVASKLGDGHVASNLVTLIGKLGLDEVTGPLRSALDQRVNRISSSRSTSPEMPTASTTPTPRA